jgi:hypothetical protein
LVIRSGRKRSVRQHKKYRIRAGRTGSIRRVRLRDWTDWIRHFSELLQLGVVTGTVRFDGGRTGTSGRESVYGESERRVDHLISNQRPI